MSRLRILHVAAEMAPFAKAGGLADVTAGLSAAQAAAGHDVRVVLPDYGGVRPRHLVVAPVGGTHATDVAGTTLQFGFSRPHPDAPLATGVYFVRCEPLFGAGGIYGGGEREAHRFVVLCRAALALCHDLDWAPHIVHCHDWHTALTPLLMDVDRHASRRFADTRAVLTIHNIGYQGDFDAAVLADTGLGEIAATLRPDAGERVNFLRAGIRRADALTTVSPTHAREILTPGYGMGLQGELAARADRLTGILNGADYRLWDPAADPLIPARYAPRELAGKLACRATLERELDLDLPVGAPVAGLVSRLVEQKGIDLVAAALDMVLDEAPFGAALLGDGEPRFVAELEALEQRFPGRVRFVRGYDEELAHRIIAGSDLLLVPSRYEPCGLTQMYAMRYGTVPVVRRTGGLADTVVHFDARHGSGTGAVFEDADANGLAWALRTALGWYREPDVWRTVMRNAMAADFSWSRQAPLYLALYASLTAPASLP